ncbi:MAG: hypothetical protein IJ143_07435 [Neisseriaceae bacterium]|nr:hypothetical protein [Neisseriaceae bacterium]
MKNTALILTAAVLSVSAVSHAQPNNGKNNDAVEQVTHQCLNEKRLSSCTLLALRASEVEKNPEKTKKFLELSCPQNSKKYDPTACGLLGTSYAPKFETIVDGVEISFSGKSSLNNQPNLQKAKFYFERACRSSVNSEYSFTAANKQEYCLGYKALQQIK